MRKTSLRPPRVLKLVFLGAGSVGKTSIIEQMVYGVFEPGKVCHSNLYTTVTNDYSDADLADDL